VSNRCDREAASWDSITRNRIAALQEKFDKVFSSILFNLYSLYITKEALEGSGYFNIGGQVTVCVKYADNLMLQTKEETVPQGTN